MKIALYIIWILVSAAIFAKSIESKKYEWLAMPSILSCIIAVIMWMFAMIESIYK